MYFNIKDQINALIKNFYFQIREHYGIQRTEIALKTIDEINANKQLLSNIKLGIEIRDSCWYAPIALQQSIEMIKDTISPKSYTDSKCMSNEVS